LLIISALGYVDQRGMLSIYRQTANTRLAVCCMVTVS
jgi:hypothetical protein